MKKSFAIVGAAGLLVVAFSPAAAATTGSISTSQACKPATIATTTAATIQRVDAKRIVVRGQTAYWTGKGWKQVPPASYRLTLQKLAGTKWTYVTRIKPNASTRVVGTAGTYRLAFPKPCNAATAASVSKRITIAAPPKPPSVSQRNALRAAQDYLRYSGFSRQGLIDQLSSQYGEKFPVADATWAVDHLHANWNEQAVRVGQSYLKLQGFSRDGLIEQLSSPYGDKFTVAEATYAADKLGL